VRLTIHRGQRSNGHELSLTITAGEGL
jgi:hypothetical protein